MCRLERLKCKTLICVQRLCRIEIIPVYTGVGLGSFRCNVAHYALKHAPTTSKCLGWPNGTHAIKNSFLSLWREFRICLLIKAPKLVPVIVPNQHFLA